MEEGSTLIAPLTIGEYLTFLLPRLANTHRRHVPRWPADTFALAMSLIQKSGIYTLVLNDWPPPAEDEQTTVKWTERMREVGEQWREIAGDETRSLPRFVQARWRKLIKSFSMSLDQLREDPSLAHALFELAAMADEASAGVGLPRSSDISGSSASFYRRARRQLLPNDKGSSLCIEIDPTRLRILPKMHAPSKGLTIRSLSHHLALCAGDEIYPFWETSIAYASQRNGLNLLVVPWPERVKPVQFQRVPRRGSGMRNMPDNFGFFRYVPEPERNKDGQVTPDGFITHVKRYTAKLSLSWGESTESSFLSWLWSPRNSRRYATRSSRKERSS
jgi:hypothetical protein